MTAHGGCAFSQALLLLGRVPWHANGLTAHRMRRLVSGGVCAPFAVRLGQRRLPAQRWIIDCARRVHAPLALAPSSVPTHNCLIMEARMFTIDLLLRARLCVQHATRSARGPCAHRHVFGKTAIAKKVNHYAPCEVLSTVANTSLS